MMKRLTAILLGTLIALPVVADDVDRTVDAAADGHVHVSNIAGEVTIRGWSRNEVEVTGELGRNVEELIVERDGNRVTIKVKVPRRSGRGIASDLHIQVPQGSSIDVGTVSADIDVTEVQGEQGLNTVSGDVNTEAFGNDISAESVSGDIEVSGQKKDAETDASTVSGNVTLFRVAGAVEAASVSGDVIVDEGSFDRASLETVNGDIVFHSDVRNGGKISAETVNGNIDLEFDRKVGGRYNIDTFNGNIRNCYGPKAVRTSKYTPGWELNFEEGDGNARVNVSTLNGDISICD